MEDDQYNDFSNRSVPAPKSNQQQTPMGIGEKKSAMAVETAENTSLLSANEDIELQHSEDSGNNVILPTENIMPDRPPSDIARDTKRILEIAYGSEDSKDTKSDQMENCAETDEESEDENTKNQNKTGDNGSYDETIELKEGQFIINGYVINPRPKKKKATKNKTKKKVTKKKDSKDSTTKKAKKKKSAKKEKESDGANSTDYSGATTSSDTGKAVDVGHAKSESESLLNTIDENAEGQSPARPTAGKKKKKKKKKTKKKGKKKTLLGIQRDAAGRIVRKRKYVKHRHKVVKKHLIKKGKDAKVSLDPIMETDEDMDNSSRHSSLSRRTLNSLQKSDREEDGSNHGLDPSDTIPKDKPHGESSKTDAFFDSDESYSSATSSEYSSFDSDDEEWIYVTSKGIFLIGCLVVLSIGLGIGLTYYFLQEGSSAPTTNTTAAPTTDVPTTDAPTGITPSPTLMVLPTAIPTFPAPTISSMPSESVSPTEEPTSSPVPTIATTTLAPTLNRLEYLSQLVSTISTEYRQTGTPQADAFEWMTTRDFLNWSELQDRELVERYIFAVFYFAMGGTQWKRDTDWLSELHTCDWYGLECNLDAFVIDIFLAENGMIGTLPRELSNILDLESISIELNVIEGAIPSEFGALTKLTDLTLSSTANLDFQGTLPSEVGNLSNLRRLRMRSNGLTGSIPSEIGQGLTSLTELDLSQNDMSGSIPDVLPGSLRTINLAWNLFDGSIPSSLFKLTELVSLDLDINYFTGPLSKDIIKLSNLETLSIAQNSLTGTLATELGRMTMLASFRLQSNGIRGSIPSELGSLTNIRYLFLSSNQISGTIPSELGNLSNLEWLDLSKNLLTGILPEELKNLTSAAIDVYENNLETP